MSAGKSRTAAAVRLPLEREREEKKRKEGIKLIVYMEQELLRLLYHLLMALSYTKAAEKS